MFVSLLICLYLSLPKIARLPPLFFHYSPRACLGSPFGRCFLWLYRSVLPNLWEPLVGVFVHFLVFAHVFLSLLSFLSLSLSAFLLPYSFTEYKHIFECEIVSRREMQGDWLILRGFVVLLLVTW